jgi:hypothetical protein
MCPRWLDKRTGVHLALDTGGGAFARLWATALANIVDMGYVKATGNSVVITLPKTALKPAVTFEWKIPKWSNAIERDRARTYFQAYAAGAATWSRRWLSCRRAAPRHGPNSRCPTRPSAAAFTKRCAAFSRITWWSRRRDRQLSSLSVDAVERHATRQFWDAGTL